MNVNSSLKHKNYELLNLLGYGLAKFSNSLIEQFGFTTKQAFFKYFVDLGLVDTPSVVKNRMDLFDPYFENGRKGWWQKAEVYRHRKTMIDSLFGDEGVEGYASIIKLYLREHYRLDYPVESIKPLTETRFRQLQQTGLEAEQYFITNFQEIGIFKNGVITDARMYGDGYDFQIDVSNKSFLAEVKGIRGDRGRFRLTQNEYKKAHEYKADYFIALVMRLESYPIFKILCNPLENLIFDEKIIKSRETREYQLTSDITID